MSWSKRGVTFTVYTFGTIFAVCFNTIWFCTARTENGWFTADCLGMSKSMAFKVVHRVWNVKPDVTAKIARCYCFQEFRWVKWEYGIFGWDYASIITCWLCVVSKTRRKSYPWGARSKENDDSFSWMLPRLPMKVEN